ncbi:MAG: hypothetical protein HGA45_20565 [Chloroflexales bacterium]|nr:hypothetical protein [Chloroflexales bacterium]
MPDSILFIAVARQQGYSVQAAQAALAAVRARLAEGGVAARRFYIYRTGDGGVGGGEGPTGEALGRPRLLLAFQSADAALSFAQGAGLGKSPRLIALSLSQALAALIQRPVIGALLIAAEDDSAVALNTLPSGLRIERATLIDLLAGVTP